MAKQSNKSFESNKSSSVCKYLTSCSYKEGDNNLISNVLDIGAGAVQVPHVKNIDDIKTLRQYSKFFPDGSRGM